MKLRLLLPLLLCVIAWGQSKDELKRQVEILAREKAALAAALAAARSGRAADTKTGADSARVASDERNAARTTAETNAQEARQAALRAAEEAAATRAELARESKAENSSDNALMILQVFGFLSMLTGLLYQSFRASRERRWAIEDAERKNSELVAVVKESANQSTAAIEHSNNLTQKIVDMREDLVAGLQGKQDTKAPAR